METAGDPPRDLPVRFDHHAWETSVAGAGAGRDPQAVRWAMVVALTVFLIGGAAVTIPVAGIYGYGAVVGVFMAIVMAQDAIVERLAHGWPRSATLRCSGDTLTVDGRTAPLKGVRVEHDDETLRITGAGLDWSFRAEHHAHVRWIVDAIAEARAELPPSAPAVPDGLKRLREGGPRRTE